MTDPAFKNVGKVPGMEVWRIENKVPVPVPTDQYGKLYEGDSYILLKTVQKGSALSWNLHFWLGSETSQDEMGIAAYKTVELDDSLGGGAVQYRECQGRESELFLSYFKSKGLQYLPGGVASGFRHVERNVYENRLLQLKGHRTVRVSEVELKNSSLNDGDVFILDCGLTLYLFIGSQANRLEKAKGVEMIHRIRNDERKGQAKVIFMEEDPKNNAFWSILGGEIPIPAAQKDDDKKSDILSRDQMKLFCLSDESGSLTFNDVTPSPENDGILRFRRELLHTKDVFILDAHTEIFVWIGKEASSEERINGMLSASKYVEKLNRPKDIPLTRLVQHGETSVFKSLFYEWTPPRRMTFGGHVSYGIAKSREQEEIDINSLVDGSTSPVNQDRDHSEDQIQEDAESPSELKIWRIENMKKVEVDKRDYGLFYQGDSYIVLYTYRAPGARKDSYMLYFWQGRESSTDEKGASAILSIDLDDQLGGKPVQVRVVQGKEPSHFRQLFKGEMLVRSGGMKSGFKNRSDEDSYDTDGVCLFHVKGTNPLNTSASQVDEKSENLNSGDCFVLETPNDIYIWIGNGSSEDEKDVAEKIGNRIQVNRKVTVVKEGDETDEFWDYLGGKQDYPSESLGQEVPKTPRLFECSNVSGVFAVNEIFDYAQDDLNVDDVYLLDTYTSLYVWIGTNANPTEERMGKDTASKYILRASESDGRSKDTPIVTVHAGNEPLLFTCHFLAWDPERLRRESFLDPYAAKLAKLRAEKEAAEAQRDQEETAKHEQYASANGIPTAPQTSTTKENPPAAPGTFFKLEELRAGNVSVDPARKEDYLSLADFQEVFGMSKDDFEKLPKWRRQAKKKEVGLF